MKRFIFLSLILIFSILAKAQDYSLTGKVSDENGQALTGASVILKGTFAGTVTNKEGIYQFKSLSKGDYTLEVSFLGYETQTRSLNLDSDAEFNFQLKSASLMSEEIIVKASRAQINTPVAQTTLDKETIGKMNVAADIPYQLELTPSVVASSENGTGMGYTNLRIRGTDMTRINVTMNGVPLNDSESQGVYFVNMPDFSASVQSVQIQRGVGTSSNGAASFGASVNFQTLTIEPKPYARISSTVGSFNTFKENVAVGTGLINNKFAFDVRASKLNSDGYIQRGFSDHQSFYMAGTYYGEKDMLKAVVMMGKERTGITWWGVPDYMLDSIRNYNPAGEYIDKNGNTQFYDGQTDNYWQNHYHIMYTRELSKYLSLNATLHATTGKGYYQQYKTGEDFADYGLPSDTVVGYSDLIRQKWLNNVFYGAIANVNYHKASLDATIGLSGNQYNGDHFGLIKWAQYNNGIPNDYEWYDNNGLKTEYSAFLKAQYELTEKLSFFADLQSRTIEYSLKGSDDDLAYLNQRYHWTFINPKVGANYQMDAYNRVYVSFAVANREPTRADIKEANKNGGDKFPKAETLNDFELGYEFRPSQYAVGINAYYMMYKNQLVQTGELNAVGYPIMTNVDQSYRAGIELMLAYKFKSLFSWQMNATISQNKILNYIEWASHYDSLWAETYEGRDLGTTDISYSPNIIASNMFRFTPIKNFGISLVTKFVGSQFIDNTSSEDRKLDPYLVNNLSFDYTYRFEKGPEIYLNFVINNILDAQYISNAYGGNWYEQDTENSWIYYYPQAGRNFMFKLGLNF
ncbi:MAG: TonB-dependent receptor [Bacteroidales bacterium]|nr:TonB-dependent receptor [Bacteroidales bacterium]